MITINGIQVDIDTSADSLSCKWAVFTVEFEFDIKLIVCHVFNQSVYDGLKNLINKTLGNKAQSIQLRQALLNSRYITVSVKKHEMQSECEVLSHKYELIKAYKSYFPYGYNTLTTGNALERNYANILRQEIISEIDNSASCACAKPLRGRGRLSKRVYKYDKETGLYLGEYNSLKEASEDTGLCTSNISMCCNGHIKAAGPFIWSYANMPIYK